MSIPAARLDALVPAFIELALSNVIREYPNKLDHVINDASDLRSPQALHPVFYGSFDWHSSVHMHWLLARLLRLTCERSHSPHALNIKRVFDLHFTASNVSDECRYLDAPARQSFERTYGWAWLLKLQTELMTLEAENPSAVRWRTALQPLAKQFIERYTHYLPLAQYPIRAGTHANSAFGLFFALEHSRLTGNAALEQLLCDKARFWFADDHSYPARYEPSGDDFLSGGLMEAALMQRVLGSEFREWWKGFRPHGDAMTVWLSPVAVSERRDPKLAHLDGLNLSRAWCWKILLPELAGTERNEAEAAIRSHLGAATAHACSGDYVGTHWLASFALLALTE